MAGSAINFSRTKVYKGSNDLNYGVDFEVSSENTKLLGGKYTATVKAKDGSNYKGTIENIEYTVLEELSPHLFQSFLAPQVQPVPYQPAL